MPSILLVENDIVFREALYDFFSDNYSCYAAKSIAEAIERLEVERFDVVLASISMPGKSGIDLLCHVMQHQPETPVIMYSGIHGVDYVQGILKMGAFDFLQKPFMLEDAARTVTRALKLRQRPEEDAAVPPAAVDSAESASHHTAIFSAVQLGGIFTLPELLDIVQRGRMDGYIELHWDNATIKLAEQMGKFNGAGGALDEAVLNCAGWIYLRGGLIIDATIDDAEGSPYRRDPEESLTLLVKLATYIGQGVRAWGFSMDEMSRPDMLSVRDNSGKVFDIITRDEQWEEQGEDAEDEPGQPASEPQPEYASIGAAGGRPSWEEVAQTIEEQLSQLA